MVQAPRNEATWRGWSCSNAKRRKRTARQTRTSWTSTARICTRSRWGVPGWPPSPRPCACSKQISPVPTPHLLHVYFCSVEGHDVRIGVVVILCLLAPQQPHALRVRLVPASPAPTPSCRWCSKVRPACSEARSGVCTLAALYRSMSAARWCRRQGTRRTWRGWSSSGAWRRRRRTASPTRTSWPSTSQTTYHAEMGECLADPLHHALALAASRSARHSPVSASNVVSGVEGHDVRVGLVVIKGCRYLK